MNVDKKEKLYFIKKILEYLIKEIRYCTIFVRDIKIYVNDIMCFKLLSQSLNYRNFSLFYK